MLPGRRLSTVTGWLPTPHGALSAGTEGSYLSGYTTVFVTPPALTPAVSINHSWCEIKYKYSNWKSRWPIIPESAHGTMHLQLKWHHQHIAVQKRYSLKVLPKESHESYFPLYLSPERDSSFLQTSFVSWKRWHKATPTLLIVTLCCGGSVSQISQLGLWTAEQIQIFTRTPRQDLRLGLCLLTPGYRGSYCLCFGWMDSQYKGEAVLRSYVVGWCAIHNQFYAPRPLASNHIISIISCQLSLDFDFVLWDFDSFALSKMFVL